MTADPYTSAQSVTDAQGRPQPSTPPPRSVSEVREPVPQAEHRRKHERQPSELVRQPDGSLLFRSRCSCGWQSEPVGMAQTFLVLDEHWQDRCC